MKDYQSYTIDSSLETKKYLKELVQVTEEKMKDIV